MEHYVNEGWVIYEIKRFCINGAIIPYSWDERKKTPVYKFNKAKAERLLRERYKKAEVGGNIIIYCYKEEDLPEICEQYLLSK